MTHKRAWDGEEWQGFALQLVQLRHKAQNIQTVPDKVKGDAGIEFFSTDGCLYQCYAPEEVADVAKAASAMKAKCSRDLPKLEKNEATIASILQQTKAQRWILLCPFLDDKAVVAFVRERGVELLGKSLSILATNFEALVQSQDDFLTELQTLRDRSAGVPFSIKLPSDEEVLSASQTQVSVRLKEKLSRAFPGSTEDALAERATDYVRAHLVRENALDQLRTEHAVLWERSRQCLVAEERRLVTVGTASDVSDSIKRIEESLAADLPSLPRSAVTEIAIGTVSDWLIRCPLDFV